MRLIDADALKEELELSKYIIPNDLNRLLNSEINRCIEAIDNAPTVGAIPNKEKHICEDCIHNNVCEWGIFDHHAFVCDSFIDNGGIKL